MARRIDPERRCLPPAEWPRADRQAWQRAISTGDPFIGVGAASHWRESSRNRIASSYGRWINYLERAGTLDPNAMPGDRVTEANLRDFIGQLSSQVASVTLANRIVDLGETIRVMHPEADRTLLRLAASRLKARAKPSRDKRSLYVHPRRLLELGYSLLDESGHSSPLSAIKQALRARDGLIILILASRVIRRASLASLRINKHLARNEAGYVIRLARSETKNHRPFETALPTSLTEPLNNYLQYHRPVLLKGAITDRLWITQQSAPLSDHALYAMVCGQSERRLGVRLTPHLFRDCAATVIAIEDPAHAGIASTILHHQDPRIRDRHYNHARGLKASRHFQHSISEQRAEAESSRSKRSRTLRKSAQ